MAHNKLIIKGARVHNLKNINLELPRNQLVVFTGLSGSGKSSLAFDTIYAEGQRRYVESLSAYARQFLGQMDKPDVDLIEGLSPAISIDQKTTNKNPRSTVGTVTEVYDYLRLLFARIGHPHCPQCGRAISQQTVSQMVDQLVELPQRTRLQLLAPVVRGRKGEHQRVIEELRRKGFVRVRLDGQVRELGEDIELDKKRQHTLEAVIDRLVIKEGIEARLADSLATALELGEGLVIALVEEGEQQRELVFSERFACPACGISLPEITPRTFSFNSPYGACSQCNGLGSTMEVDPDLMLPNPGLTLSEGAIEPWRRSISPYYQHLLQAVAAHYGFSVEVPVNQLTAEQRQVLLWGSGKERVRLRYTSRLGEGRDYNAPFEGVIPNLQRRYRESTSDHAREEIEAYMTSRTCPACQGARLRPEVLAVLVGELNIHQVAALTISQALQYIRSLTLTEREQAIARQVSKEIGERLGFLESVGLDYLTLNRAAGSLSGGEAQRIRLATQVGSGLTGVLYILDEPSIGLHQRDNARLIATLERLRDLGNTVIVVEHDEETIRAADYLVDIGPAAGAQGGQVVVAGKLEEIKACRRSLTGDYLSGRRRIAVPATRRQGNGHWLRVLGACEHNLKDVDCAIPLGTLTCVTGVSGSGKSTLVHEILFNRLAQELNRVRVRPGEHQRVEGLEHLDKAIEIDQSPIGRTPRSNPTTYTGAFDSIRELFAQASLSRVRGYKPGRFSFNVKGGRCEACRGDGIIKIEMHFLPDVYVPCEVCKGKRYNRETLEVEFKGKNIAQILELTVDEAVDWFSSHPRIYRKLKTLQEVGLGYIRLGQPATTLSGGEAQRVKLATELSRRSNGRTIYFLDEPTTGLHPADIAHLLQVLNQLVEAGNTVVVIEHNLDVIKTADYLIDLGPEGGDRGGQVVASGTPEEVAWESASYTGRFLANVLGEKNYEPGRKISAVTG